MIMARPKYADKVYSSAHISIEFPICCYKPLEPAIAHYLQVCSACLGKLDIHVTKSSSSSSAGTMGIVRLLFSLRLPVVLVATFRRPGVR